MVLATSVKQKDVNLASFDSKNSRAYCESLAAKLKSSDLPASCRQLFDEDAKKVDAFAGMRPNEAIKARNSLKQGIESHAKVQRRLTTGSKYQ
ncbi:hypothetical protein MPSEU_000322300 [Mayamaea pseudoterrestris]|nr:hypothetical protein MPSEU_000322300 [Mayamaea pseudoterrestris]